MALIDPFQPLASGSTVATTGAVVALPGGVNPPPNVLLYNSDASVTAYVAFGNATVTAVAPVANTSAGDLPVPPGARYVISRPTDATHMDTTGGTVFATVGWGV